MARKMIAAFIVLIGAATGVYVNPWIGGGLMVAGLALGIKSAR